MAKDREPLENWSEQTPDLSSKFYCRHFEIKTYLGKLSMLWKEIDKRMPNPMTCSYDITAFKVLDQALILWTSTH